MNGDARNLAAENADENYRNMEKVCAEWKSLYQEMEPVFFEMLEHSQCQHGWSDSLSQTLFDKIQQLRHKKSISDRIKQGHKRFAECNSKEQFEAFAEERI